MEMFLGMTIGFLVLLAVVVARSRYLDFQAQTPEDYTSNSPDFDIRRHLNGPLACEGVIYGPTGRVTSRFVADFEGTWAGDEGRLAEHFSYDSGTVQDREWRLKVDANGQITAEADDLVGRGTGQQLGSSVCLRYTIRLPESAGGHALDVTDWMYLLENGTIMNRSQFRKFGIKVGELVATMRPLADSKDDAQKDAA